MKNLKLLMVTSKIFAVNKMLNIFLRSLKYRLHWYHKNIFEKLIRLQHGLIIFVMLFIQTFGLFIILITKPIIFVLTAKSINLPYFYNIVLIQVIYLAWIIWQKESILPSSIKIFFNSLPVSPWINRLIDFIMILFANNIFWLPFIAIFVIKNTNTLYNKIFFARLVLLIASILIIQMTWLFKKINKNFLILYGALHKASSFSKFNKHFPLLSIQFLILWRKHRIEMIWRLLASLTVIIFGYKLIINNIISIPTLSIIIASLIMFIISGCYPLFKETRCSYLLYFKSLPISSLRWYLLDYTFLLILSLSLNMGFVLLLFTKDKLNFIIISSTILTLVITGALLSFTRNYFSKQGTWISFVSISAYLFLFINIFHGILR